ncbi:MAG TPA: TetR/AcrR family transcriptional regulator [Methylovirgula sp.]|nr:TetR/AcrR family transcriptional regulator [Methylovirgula sp.]
MYTRYTQNAKLKSSKFNRNVMKRAYVSPVRTAAAAAKRELVVDAAIRLLGRDAGPPSMRDVAREAGVTRLTLYKQFGSRKGLLETVFDECARRGGLGRIPDAMALADPREALDRLIEIFCDFWSADLAFARLHDTAAVDPEFADTIAERIERRRKAIGALVNRLKPEPQYQGVREGLVDLIFGLTSHAMFQLLRKGRSKEAACALLKEAIAAILR